MKEYTCPECFNILRRMEEYPETAVHYSCHNKECGWTSPTGEDEVMDLVQAYAKLKYKEKLSKNFGVSLHLRGADSIPKPILDDVDFERGYNAGSQGQECKESTTNYLNGFLRGREFNPKRGP